MFLEHYKLYWTNYVNFRGRTPRSGFWFAFLWGVIIVVILGLITIAVSSSFIFDLVDDLVYYGSSNPLGVFDSIFGAAGGLFAIIIIAIALFIANILPTLAICIRRLHDTGRRWFWMFILLGPIIFYIVVLLIVFLSLSWEVLAFFAFVTLIMPFVFLACGIFFLVLMCLPTSPNAIGASTHAAYPQWQDGYGGYSGGDQRTASIIGISGMYSGAAFPIESDEELIMGRDAMLSHIVITENAEKISRKHITISFDAYDNVYTVTDHSSNGTYLDDGTRLVANIPVRLQRGTVIYLAKRENSFRLG